MGYLRKKLPHRRKDVPTTGIHETEKSQIDVLWARGEMGSRGPVKRIINTDIEGRRPVGRPLTRWRNVLRRDLGSSGLSLNKAEEKAND